MIEINWPQTLALAGAGLALWAGEYTAAAVLWASVNVVANMKAK